MTEEFEHRGGSSTTSRILPILAVVIGVGIGAYFLLFNSRTAPPESPAETPHPEVAPPPTVNPAPGTQESSGSAAPQVPRIPAAPALQQVLPDLEDSDSEVREHLRALLGNGPLAAWLRADSLVQRIAVLIAGLGSGDYSLETLLLAPPAGGFQVDSRGDGIYLSPRNYARYNAVTGLIDGLDVTAIVEFFQRYRPLLEAGYGDLGHPPEQLDTALLGAIDHLLGTPELADPPALAHESVAYTYADPGLEGLSAARKQLLRMGPAHTRTVKAKLKALRAALLAAPPIATDSASEADSAPN